MSKKVYIVTDGTYSEYHIEAVFSSERQALIYCATHCGEDGEVSEYTLDNHIFKTKNKPMSLWKGQFYTRVSSLDGMPFTHLDVFKQGYSLKDIYEVTKKQHGDNITITITLNSGISETEAERMLWDLYERWKQKDEKDAQ